MYKIDFSILNIHLFIQCLACGILDHNVEKIRLFPETALTQLFTKKIFSLVFH
jgi:hypothetical protein